MPKKFSRQLTKVHLRLFTSDWETLNQMFGGSDVKATEAVRNIVAAAVAHLRSRSDKAIDQELEGLDNLEELAKDVELEELKPISTQRQIKTVEKESANV